MPQSSVPSTTPVSSTVSDISDPLEDSELMGDDLDSLLDCIPTEQEPAEVKPVCLSLQTCTHTLFTDCGMKVSLAGKKLLSLIVWNNT